MLAPPDSGNIENDFANLMVFSHNINNDSEDEAPTYYEIDHLIKNISEMLQSNLEECQNEDEAVSATILEFKQELDEERILNMIDY